MFNWGHVWWHWSPIQKCDIVIWIKLLCDSSCMWPSTILLQNSASFGKIVLHEYVSYMKGTTIFANTLFTYTLAFTLLLKTTRRVLLCRVIPPHTCIDPTVTSYFWLDVFAAVRINPVPYMILHHLLDLTLSGDTRTWLSWHREVFYVPCLVDALFQARYSRSTAAKRCCNVLFGSNHHEHPKCSVSFIFWKPWHDRNETYSTSTKPFLYNADQPITWRKEKFENLHWSCCTWFTCIFTKSLFVSILFLLCRNYQWICKHKR